MISRKVGNFGSNRNGVIEIMEMALTAYGGSRKKTYER